MSEGEAQESKCSRCSGHVKWSKPWEKMQKKEDVKENRSNAY